MGRIGTMIDCSRNAVMSVSAVKRWIDIISDMGFNTLLLYIEDTYEISGEPYFGYKRGRYSKAELKEMDDYACAHSVELIPCIQTLAHLNCLTRWQSYQDMFDVGDILLVGDERVYELIDKMLKTVSECFRSKLVNIGVDEAHLLGRGRYMDIHGAADRKEILLKHIERISELGRKYDQQLLMWSDMFYELANGKYYRESSDGVNPLEYARSRIPDNISLIYWDYYSKERGRYEQMIAEQKELSAELWFAGGLWTWCGFAPHNDYSIQVSAPAIEACKQSGIENIFFTLWGDDGGECSRFSMLPALFYVSELIKGEAEPEVIKSKFHEKFGIEWDAFMLLDLPDTYSAASDEVCNPDKYLLYNDCFTGLMDSTLAGDECRRYRACADRLERLGENTPWAALFETQYRLCRVLELKADLSRRTKAAYKDGRDALKSLTGEYLLLEERISQFYDAFKAQWFAENKASGFDVQDIRLGALLWRVKSCRRRIEEYCSGECDGIEELESENTALDTLSRQGGKHIRYNQWGNIVTANVLSWWAN